LTATLQAKKARAHEFHHSCGQMPFETWPKFPRSQAPSSPSEESVYAPCVQKKYPSTSNLQPCPQTAIRNAFDIIHTIWSALDSAQYAQRSTLDAAAQRHIAIQLVPRQFFQPRLFLCLEIRVLGLLSVIIVFSRDIRISNYISVVCCRRRQGFLWVCDW